jgi:hypothetical protein
MTPAGSGILLLDFKRYSVEEANALLSWLTDSFAEIGATRERADVAALAHDAMVRASQSNGHEDYSDRIAEAERTVVRARARMDDLMGAMQEQGIQVRDLDMGLVDFLGERDGAEVWLCWRVGEDTVSHWHGLNEGFARRRAL